MTISRGVYVILLAASVVASACGGGPTAPSTVTVPGVITTPTNPAPSTVSLHGTVAEYASPYLNEMAPIAGATVSVMGDEKTVVTDASGQYNLEAVSTRVRLRATREGYQDQEKEVQVNGNTMTVNFVMVRTCSPWPGELRAMMAQLGIADFGTCLVRFPSSQPSNYVATQRTVYYRSPSPVGGELGALAHELCHVRQHKAVLDAGKPDPKHDGESVPWWANTTEGGSFVDLTGWRLANPGGPAPSFGWVESPEPWGAGYTNPTEDNAEACAFWHNPGNDPRRGKEKLTQFAPKRAEWMRRWMP